MLRTAEEIFIELMTGEQYKDLSINESIKAAINQARKEAIEECMMVAKTKWETGHKHPESVYVDKQPFLNLINELK